MEKVKLTEICNPKQWKTIPTSDLKEDGYPVYGANGIIGYYSEYNHENETVAITCRGATCGSINITEPKSYVTGNAMCIDELRKDISVKYLYYCLKYYDFNKVISGSAQPQITRQNLDKVNIIIGDTKEQQDIVEILDTVSSLIDKRKIQLENLDNLIKSRFVELFGDTYINDKGHQEVCLEEVANIVSGITKGRKTSETELQEVPYMAVSNVKDGYIDWTTVKTIRATKTEIEQYRIKPNDILMTEGGDPDKVGRGAIIRTPLENCIHQNHIFRVRLDETIVLPEYFEEYLQHANAKRYFLRCAKQTTGIASINMGQLKRMPLLLPAIEFQIEFSEFVHQVDKLKFTIQRQLDETQQLFDALMQQYFG